MTEADASCGIPPPWQEWTSPLPGASMSLKVWRVNVDTDPLCHHAATVLSEAEALRAARFTTPLLAARYAAAHAALRRLLATEVRVPPQALAFGESPGGKPVLLSVGQGSGLDFNLSHSGPWALIGLAQGVHLGVDIEEVTAHHDWTLVAAEILAPSEQAAWRELSPDRQPDFLIRSWTNKEACLKAMGTGLAVDPRRLACRTTAVHETTFELDGSPLDTLYAWNIANPAYSASIVALVSPPALRERGATAKRAVS